MSLYLRNPRAPLAAVLATLMAGVASCGGGSEGQDGGARVATADFRFDPQRVEVKAGETVRWTNTGQTPHTVKGSGFFSTPALDAGQSYSYRFTRPGRYPYLCTLHPTLMKGVIVVS